MRPATSTASPMPRTPSTARSGVAPRSADASVASRWAMPMCRWASRAHCSAVASSTPVRCTSSRATSSTPGSRRRSTRTRERIVGREVGVARRAQDPDGALGRLLQRLEQHIAGALDHAVGVLHDDHAVAAQRRGERERSTHGASPDGDDDALGAQRREVGMRAGEHLPHRGLVARLGDERRRERVRERGAPRSGRAGDEPRVRELLGMRRRTLQQAHGVVLPPHALPGEVVDGGSCVHADQPWSGRTAARDRRRRRAARRRRDLHPAWSEAEAWSAPTMRGSPTNRQVGAGRRRARAARARAREIAPASSSAGRAASSTRKRSGSDAASARNAPRTRSWNSARSDSSRSNGLSSASSRRRASAGSRSRSTVRVGQRPSGRPQRQVADLAGIQHAPGSLVGHRRVEVAVLDDDLAAREAPGRDRRRGARGRPAGSASARGAMSPR